MNTDNDYGAEQRRARIYNERLLINWTADAKPRYRVRLWMMALFMACWFVVALVLWARGL